MSHSFRLALMLASATLLLAACGNKGPLVMPNKQPAAKPTPAATPPAKPASANPAQPR
jgi:predicted small lipoprotein YifL